MIIDNKQMTSFPNVDQNQYKLAVKWSINVPTPVQCRSYITPLFISPGVIQKWQKHRDQNPNHRNPNAGFVLSLYENQEDYNASIAFVKTA